ncbi:mechanosensitive ion channel family protein [Ensifer sp. MJa1]|uniref:mechanosensitive ion channel family protein n=1 Tax=Ensifer sp. MJa1 TaxID=2919888 RepID=UPI00300AE9AF
MDTILTASTSTIRRTALTLMAGLIIILTSIGFVSAQPAPVDKNKPELLLDLLDDPDVRDWSTSNKLATYGLEQGTAAASAEISHGMMSAVLERIDEHLAQLARSWQLLPERIGAIRRIIIEDVDEDGGLALVALITGFIATGATFSYSALHLAWPLRRWVIARNVETPVGRLGQFGGRLIVGMLMITAFTVGSAGAFLLFEWPPLLREIALAYLTAAIATWAARIIVRVALLPSFMRVTRAREARAFDVADAHADHWYRWIGIFVTVLAVSLASISLRLRFGLTREDVLVLVILVDFVFLLIALLAVWTRPVAEPKPPQQSAHIGHKGTNWLLSAYFVLLFLLGMCGGNAAFWFAIAVVAVPVTMIFATRAVAYVLRPPRLEKGSNAVPFSAVSIAVVDRAIRLTIIVLGAYLLANAWGLDMASMADTSPQASVIIRGLLSAAVVALGADFLWSITKAIIQHKISHASSASTEETAGTILDPHDARLRTLLPILQNIILASIIVTTVLTILSSLGIQIGPLIAGAGVIGVAVGFGAQTIVKDVIAGIFYLLDDAFRIGEYISTGKFSGTVESFSLRSVKLRHHRGPIYTIPFGELGAVQNGSRDWATDKFNITVAFDADLEVARKLIKKLGLELAEDPEYRPWIIEPIKLQGVQEFGEYGIVLRIKVTTRPGGAYDMKRVFLLRVRELFKQNGIEIPVPTVHIQGGATTGQPTVGDDQAVAAQAYLERKKAAMSIPGEEEEI